MTSTPSTEVKRGVIFSFLDGELRIKLRGHGEQDGWGQFIFDEKQVEIVPHEERDGASHVVDIPKSELIALRDFLIRTLDIEG